MLQREQVGNPRAQQLRKGDEIRKRQPPQRARHKQAHHGHHQNRIAAHLAAQQHNQAGGNAGSEHHGENIARALELDDAVGKTHRSAGSHGGQPHRNRFNRREFKHIADGHAHGDADHGVGGADHLREHAQRLAIRRERLKQFAQQRTRHQSDHNA